MAKFIPATKYQDAHWLRKTTEYRVTLYDGDGEGDCDHHDTKEDAIRNAKEYHAETGLRAMVEKLVWTERSWDGENGWDDHDGWGPKETKIWDSDK